MTTGLSTRVGSVELKSPVMTAAGTAGFGLELAGYGDLAELGAVVTKSLAPFAWDGNPAPRLATMDEHLVNSVGLAGPGVEAWRRDDAPRLQAAGATVVVSIWGRRSEDYAAAAAALAGEPIVAIEVNASCPNVEDRSQMFAHSATATAELVEAARAGHHPVWVKLSPNTPDLIDIAASAVAAGAEALVLVNTLLALVMDVEHRRPALGAGGGGLSGAGLGPVALRAVYDCRSALPTTPIVGVGGIARGRDAVAMLMAGANAVQVGTASLADPRAPWRVQRGLVHWMRRHGVANVSDLVGAGHD